MAKSFGSAFWPLLRIFVRWYHRPDHRFIDEPNLRTRGALLKHVRLLMHWTTYTVYVYYRGMVKRRRRGKAKLTFIREWRKHRKLNQEELAKQAGVTQETISRLETGGIRYTQELLEDVAVALRCTPADLISRDPSGASPVWVVWERIPLSRRAMALETLVVFTKPEREK